MLDIRAENCRTLDSNVHVLHCCCINGGSVSWSIVALSQTNNYLE